MLRPFCEPPDWREPRRTCGLAAARRNAARRRPEHFVPGARDAIEAYAAEFYAGDAAGFRGACAAPAHAGPAGPGEPPSDAAFRRQAAWLPADAGADVRVLCFDALAAVPNSNIQLDFNVRLCDRFDATFLAWLRELDESNRFVQKSAESTSI